MLSSRPSATSVPPPTPRTTHKAPSSAPAGFLFFLPRPYSPAPGAQAASVFNSFYNDCGIFGVYGAAPAEGMGQLVAVVCEELTKMGCVACTPMPVPAAGALPCSPRVPAVLLAPSNPPPPPFRLNSGAISDVELSRAKNQLKSSLLMNLESRPVLFEDIGRQVLTYGARTDPAELVAQIEAVTAADLNAAAAAMLKTPPSVVVYGDTTSVPRYDLIAKQFG